MKKIDLGQMISILANVGVIAGIVFLGFEIRQNNKLMETEARYFRLERLNETSRDLYSVPGMAELLVKLGNGTELSEEEEFRVYAFNILRLRGIQSQWEDSIEGTLIPNVRGMREAFRGNIYNAPMQEAWERSKPMFSQEFVQWMEGNVVN